MYDFRRKRVIKFLRADPHTVDEVADYLVRELGYTEVSPSDETYQTEYSNLRVAFSVAILSETAWRYSRSPKGSSSGDRKKCHGVYEAGRTENRELRGPFQRQSLILIFICTGKRAGILRNGVYQ